MLITVNRILVAIYRESSSAINCNSIVQTKTWQGLENYVLLLQVTQVVRLVGLCREQKQKVTMSHARKESNGFQETVSDNVKPSFYVNVS